MPRIMREERLVFLKVNEKDELMGEGITDFTVATNPKTSSVQYIHKRNASGGLSGYAPTATFTAHAFSDDPVMEYLVELGRTLSVGVDAQSDIKQVDTWEKNEAGKCKAVKQNVIISIDNPGSGVAGEALTVSGTITYDGDPIQGWYDIATNTFSELA